jgi:hypothetical protein
MPSVSLIYSGEYLVASQLPAGRRITARIHAVAVESVGQGQDQTQKLALELASQDGRPWPRRLLLNKTNATIIANAFGDEANGWTGNAIEIWQDQVSFQGKVVPGVRVAAVRSSAPAPHLQPQSARGNGGDSGNGIHIPEQSIADALDDAVPF